ncbi:hypothetical protein PTB13_26940, partial [Bacillus sp. MHSD17]|nr:hypothetical protein [Bacillus sp. MHSD17]
MYAATPWLTERHGYDPTYPMSVWFWDEKLEGNIKNELIKLGLKETEQNIAMVANLHTIHPTINLPEGFTIQKAASSGQIKKFGEALASLFGTSEEGIYVQSFYNQTASFHLWNSENMKLYLGFYKDEVVSVGSLVCTQDSIGIYDIATSRIVAMSFCEPRSCCVHLSS